MTEKSHEPNKNISVASSLPLTRLWTVYFSSLPILTWIIKSKSLPSPDPDLNFKIFLATIVVSFTTLLHISYQNLIHQKATSRIPPIPIVPGAHFLFGHLTYLLDHNRNHYIFNHAHKESGISAFYTLNMPCCSVLRADHARIILRNSSSRDFISFIVRHGRKTLGEESLILIPGGNRWKRQRKVVQRAFRRDVMLAGRKRVGECALVVVDWILRACEGGVSGCGSSGSGSGSVHKSHCQGYGEHSCGKGSVRLQVGDFFKLYALDVFGKVAMAYDFNCIPILEDPSSNGRKKENGVNGTCNNNNSSNACGHQTKHPRCNSSLCECLKMPDEAAAFDKLEADVGKRVYPTALIDPRKQFYWVPSKENREYRRNMKTSKELMSRIIRTQLNDVLNEGKHNVNSNRKGGEAEENDNMVKHLVKSTIEEHFNPSPDSNGSKEGTSACPFASSNASQSSDHNNDSTTTSLNISEKDQEEIVNLVQSILSTLILAGHETTSTSLSYVMYCLSKHPRCQERCAEEARRVLGTRDRISKSEENVFHDDQLIYCKAVFQESIRLYLPLMFTTRVMTKDVTLEYEGDEDATNGESGVAANHREASNGSHKHTVVIPKGTRVFVPPAIIHRDERNFARPEEFIPERWVRWEQDGQGSGAWVEREYEKESGSLCTISEDGDGSSDSIQNSVSGKYTDENADADTIPAANPNNFFSFSDGARNCVGKRLAIMESTILIAALMRDLCVDIVNPSEKEEFELEAVRRFVTLAPKSMPIVFWKRD